MKRIVLTALIIYIALSSSVVYATQTATIAETD